MNVHNLKPFQKGVSGNPAGRPPKIPAIDELLAKVLSDEVDGVTIAEQILLTVAKQAIAGNLHAAEIILNRAYGKPKQAAPSDDNSETVIRIIREPEKMTTEELRTELHRLNNLNRSPNTKEVHEMTNEELALIIQQGVETDV
jgi:hypothetical protein